MPLEVFNNKESDLVHQCISVINKKNRQDDADKINKNINALVELVKAISQYPSILAESSLCNVTRSVGTLMEILRQHEGLDKIMYSPIKAVLGKGFHLAKISFFNMLSLIANDISELNEKVPIIIEYITNTIFTILSEEVFLSIVEDKESSDTVRNRAGFLLSNLWEYRISEGVNDFAPILNSIWEARKKLIPIYGTMMGTVELLQVSENVDPVWLEFIQDENSSDEVLQSVEEFLFTLAYEELKNLREKMDDMGLNVVTRETVESIIGKRKLYEHFNVSDSREMYRFFRVRRSNARFRKRAEMPGPKKTIEEHIMCYLLSSNAWIPF